MNLNDLLLGKKIDPREVLVLRHRPTEPELNKVFPLIASDQPDLFDAYQRAQTEKLEKAMSLMIDSGYLASFVAHGPGRAAFVGLYKIVASRPLTFEQYWKIPANLKLKALGMRGFTGERPSILWFDLMLNGKRCFEGTCVLLTGRESVGAIDVGRRHYDDHAGRS